MNIIIYIFLFKQLRDSSYHFPITYPVIYVYLLSTMNVSKKNFCKKILLMGIRGKINVL